MQKCYKKWIFGVGLVFYLGVVCLLFAIQDQSSRIFVIRPGESTRFIAEKLDKEGFIQSSFLFYGIARLSGAEKNLRAGEFQLKSGYSSFKILDILQEKEGAASLVSVTIPEGKNLGEIAKILQDQGMVDSREFLKYMQHQAKRDLASEISFLSQIPTDNLEGYLYPETYVFARGVDMKKIVGTMLMQFENEIVSKWNPRKYPRLSFHKMVTLASIIQSEAAREAEMPKISAVFHNRLRKRMVLASCPTVAYAMGQPRKRFLTYKDLEFKSVYNTYRRQGLPPTPIASPGIAAFDAAMSPKPKFSYLYFVSKGDGTHQFSRSMAEHLAHQKRISAKYIIN